MILFLNESTLKILQKILEIHYTSTPFGVRQKFLHIIRGYIDIGIVGIAVLLLLEFWQGKKSSWIKAKGHHWLKRVGMMHLWKGVTKKDHEE